MQETNSRLLIALNLHKCGNLDDAEKIYCEVLNVDKKNLNAINLLSDIKIKQKKFQDAKKILEEGVKFYPSFFDFWFNLGIVCKNLEEFDEALLAYDKALDIEPDNVQCFFNLGNLWERKNDTKTAIKFYKKAYELNTNPNDIYIPYFLSISYLKEKDFKKGIPLHEYRPSRPFIVECEGKEYEKVKTTPIWDGTPMPDKTLFVYYECALGDTIMYVRYLKLLKGMFKKIIFKPQVCFVDFFKNQDFGIDIEFVENKTRPEEVQFDAHIPLMSLPLALKQFDENIPFPKDYLKPDKNKAQDFKQKYFNNNKFKIGIKGTGNTNNDNTRIIDPKAFYKLFDIKNVQFYSLQLEDGADDFKKMPNIIDLAPHLHDFSDTAAMIENLDLVICNDTSVAHLAGAIHKRLWVALPFVQNWRWHSDISYSPWYDSAKIFKQIEPANWDEVFDRIKQELIKII